MGRLLRRLGWIVLGGVLCSIAAFLIVMFYTRTENFHRILSEKALTAINGSIRGTVSWHGLEGSIWRGLRVKDLELSYRDRVIFKAARAEIDYALLPLLWKQVRLTRLAATRPTLDLRKQPDGEWNVVEALSSGEPSSGPFDWTIEISGINLASGEMTLRPVAGSADSYWLRKLDISGRLRIADGLNVSLDRLASWVDTPQVAQVYVNGGLDYRQSGQSQNLQFKSFWLQSRLSHVRLSGAIKNFSDFDSDLDVSIRRLAAQDLVRYVRQWPAGIDVTGQLSARGPANALVGTLNLRLAGGQISGSMRADLLSGPKPYSADLAIRGLPLGAVLPNQKIAGVVSAHVKIAGAGTASDALTATGDARVQSLTMAARDFGVVSVQVKLRGKAASVDGQLNGPMGQANWRSQLSFAATPQYRANLTFRAVDVARLWQLKDAPNGKLNFDATVNGAGFDVTTMNSQAVIELLPSQWQTVDIERGKINAQIASGRVKIEQLWLRAGSALLSAQGDLGVAAPQSGRINYQLQVADLGPWLNLIGRQGGSGRLDLRGQAEGNLTRLQTRGSLQSYALKSAEGSAAAVRADFNLQRDAAAALPSGKIDVLVSDLHAGVDLAEVRAALTLPLAPQQAIGVRADARDSTGRQHRLVAEIENPQADFVVRARELMLTLSDGPWRLEAPATIARRGNDFILDRVSMRNGRAQLAAEGRFALQGNQAVSVQANDIPLAAFNAVLPRGADPTSVLSGQVQLRGTAALPELDGALQLSSGQIAGQNYQGARLQADYRGQRIALDMTIDQDSTHNFQVRGTIPLALAWVPRWRAQLLPGMELRAQSNGLSLAFLNTLKLPAENIAGRVALDMVVTGTPSAPQPRGTLQLLDGGFALRDLGIRVSDFAVSARVDPSRVTVTHLVARSGGGNLDGSGVVTLKDFQVQNMDLRLDARRWPAIQTERYRALVDGDVRLGGSLAAPGLAGKVTVIEGTLRPDLSVLDRNPVALKRDSTIVVVQHRGGQPIETARSDKNGTAKSDLWRALAIDLGVTVPNNLWIRHANAEVELTGNLTLGKRPNSEPTLTGAIDAVRGWLGFQGRRFQISRGRVQFTGGQPIDPLIDVVADYRVNDYVVNAIAGGRANKPTLVLTSQPQLEQADILALLLFGKTTTNLSGGEQLALQKNAIDITSSFAAAQIGKAVSNALGLESLGVDLRDISVSGGQVRYGHYIGRQTYVSASQEISGEHGREFRVEYQLTPQIKIDATTTVSGNSGVDIIWHKRY